MIVVELSIFRDFAFFHCGRKETPKTGARARKRKNAIIVIKLFEFYQNKIDKFFFAAPNNKLSFLFFIHKCFGDVVQVNIVVTSAGYMHRPSANSKTKQNE